MLTPTTSAPGGACTATYRTVNSWPGGSAFNGWTVRWTLSGGPTINQVWNGTLSASGTSVSVRDVSYNGSLPAAGSTTFGVIEGGAPSTPTLTCASP